jgi:hypothetical protein
MGNQKNRKTTAAAKKPPGKKVGRPRKAVAVELDDAEQSAKVYLVYFILQHRVIDYFIGTSDAGKKV